MGDNFLSVRSSSRSFYSCWNRHKVEFGVLCVNVNLLLGTMKKSTSSNIQTARFYKHRDFEYSDRRLPRRASIYHCPCLTPLIRQILWIFNVARGRCAKPNLYGHRGKSTCRCPLYGAPDPYTTGHFRKSIYNLQGGLLWPPTDRPTTGPAFNRDVFVRWRLIRRATALGRYSSRL